MAILTGMPAITRAVLTCLHIDPSLSRQVERDRLRAVVNIAVGKASNDVVGNAYRALRQLWFRGFPLPAFDDPSSPPLSADEARVHLSRTHAELKTRMHKPDRKEEVIFRRGSTAGQGGNPLTAARRSPPVPGQWPSIVSVD